MLPWHDDQLKISLSENFVRKKDIKGSGLKEWAWTRTRELSYMQCLSRWANVRSISYCRSNGATKTMRVD